MDDDETWKDDGPSPTLNAFDNGTESRATVVAVEEAEPVYSLDSTWSGAFGVSEDKNPPLKCGNGTVPAVNRDLAVRRLTPRECERLQGWDDDWTATGIDADGNEVVISDSARYRMIGNGVSSPVAEWIGRCIIAAHGAVEQ